MPSKEVQEELEMGATALYKISQGPTSVPDITHEGDLTSFPLPETWVSEFYEEYRKRKANSSK